MDVPYSRRSFLRKGAVLLPPMLINKVVCASATEPLQAQEGRGLSTYQLGPLIWIRWDNRVLVAYRAHSSQKYPYIYPVAGPATGLSLTAETALPWPHHRSLFFACDRVNGANYWQEEFATGQIISAGPKTGRVTADSAEIYDVCHWQKPGQLPVMRDERRITVKVVSPKLYCIEWVIEWSALVDVTIEKTNHSLFALRAAPDITPGGGGVLVNAQGQRGEKATFGQPSEWCCFYGNRKNCREETIEGITMFDHAKNPWSPCRWFTRDYGFISPTPMNFIETPVRIRAGQSLTLRYLVAAHEGSPEEANVAEIYRSWIHQAL